jgi:8-oxo-dGTP diphosphatase
MSEKPFGLTVRAVVSDGLGRCLLIRRSPANRSAAGKWEWPGGKVDPGEDFAAALHRELAEETGLAVRLTGLAGATSFEMPKAKVILLCLEAVPAGGALTLSAEHDAAEWAPIADLARWELSDTARPFMLDYAERWSQSAREHARAPTRCHAIPEDLK